ncbi:extracellular solute-binding protein [Paenibacillus thiaminolyticus]|uniref:extracellular solute-binding protein n=1 Tax=Paenibacillus thiaminolyticus TaxID=49283 RepID=UPI002542A262|nr:extracellular solute-binding protein [Paenibacillus thiaminolyticus]WII35122.1 extracellular solute-binding protein [Paenibacillus thiaminolyticus]
MQQLLWRRTMLTLLSIVMLTGMLAACSGKTEQAAETAANAPAGEVPYPASLTYWAPIGNAGTVMKSFSDMGAYQELEKRTGTKVMFQHPPAGQEADQFNLMLASGKLPDVIEYTWGGVAKGPDQAIKEKRILRLNELIDQHAPNLKAVLDARPDLKKLVTTDEGNIYVFPFLRPDEELLTFMGPTIRKDWLDKLGLQVPATIEEWEKMLIAFRDGDPNGNGKKDEIPFLLRDINVAFVGAFGITDGFYREGNEIKYGPIQPEYKDYLTMLNRWYKEGLLDKDYATTDGKLQDAKMTSNVLGSLVTYNGSGVGRYTNLMRGSHPEFELAGAPYPTAIPGKKALGQADSPFAGIGAAVSATAPNPEQIVKWMDYKYGEEGHLLFNFGVEGVSYQMENGYLKYTVEIMKNPEGLPVAEAMAKYMPVNWSGPFVQDKRYIEQYIELPEQKQAMKNWLDADRSKLQPPLTRTSDESSTYASIMADIDTYKSEMFNKFIMGAEPLDRFDAFAETIQSMGIEQAIQIQQAALDRFNKR